MIGRGFDLDEPAYGPGNPDYEYEERRDEQDALVSAAMRDILAGRFDSEVVHEAMHLGHHARYRELKDTLDMAQRAARHST